MRDEINIVNEGIKFLFPSNGTAFLNSAWKPLAKGGNETLTFLFPSNGKAFLKLGVIMNVKLTAFLFPSNGKAFLNATKGNRLTARHGRGFYSLQPGRRF